MKATIPEFIEITTAVKCVINCRICPQPLWQKTYGKNHLLSLQDFKLALSHIPKSVGLSFAGFCEPFLNPECIDMLEFASMQGRKLWLFSTLFGLAPENVERLAKVNLSWFSLHMPDNLDNAHIPSTEAYRSTVDKALRLVRVDHISRMNHNFTNNQRAGNVEGTKPFHRKGPFLCTKLSSNQFIMLPDCSVVLCCMDYGLKHKLGNLKTESYQNIQDSLELQKIKANRFMWKGNTLCRSCLYSGWRYNFGKGFRFMNDKIIQLVSGKW